MGRPTVKPARVGLELVSVEPCHPKPSPPSDTRVVGQRRGASICRGVAKSGGFRDDGPALSGSSSGPRLPLVETRPRKEARTLRARTPRYAALRASLRRGGLLGGRPRAGEAPDRRDTRRNVRTKRLDPELPRNVCPGLRMSNYCVLKAPSWESDHELHARRRAQRILRLHADR